MKLERMPVALFGATMGLAGLAYLWRLLEAEFSLPASASWGITALVSVMMLVLALAYALKFLKHREQVFQEFRNPTSLSFFSTAPIGASLVAGLWSVELPIPATGLWIIAAVMQSLLALLTLRRWMEGGVPLGAVNPAWFIPVVGNIVLPLGGVALGFVSISWMVFWIGLFWWLVLMPVVFYRLVFGEPLPMPATPTLAIMVAPPAIGYLSYQALYPGNNDFMSMFLISATGFLLVLVLSMMARLRGVPFAYPFWSLTFPAAAASRALLVFAQLHASVAGVWAATFFAGLVTLMIGLIAVRSIRAAIKGALF